MACIALILYTLEHTTSKDKERASSIKILKTMIKNLSKIKNWKHFNFQETDVVLKLEIPDGSEIWFTY